MASKKPTMAQAQLQMQLYDLRREPRLRAARKWFMQNFFLEKPEDAQQVAPPGSKQDAYVRMTISYWEMVCQMMEYGMLHEDLFFQTTNEQYLVWERIKPAIAAIRLHVHNAHMFENLEKAAKRYEKWVERRAPGHLAVVRKWMEQGLKSGQK